MASSSPDIGDLPLITPFHAPAFPTPLSITAIAVAITALFLFFVFPAHHDPSEPPILKPSIPIIGHLLSMIKHKAVFLQVIYDRTGLALASLPILNGKLYIAWDASIVQSVLSNKHLDVTPFIITFAKREVGYGKDVDKIIRETTLMDDLFTCIRNSMTQKHSNNISANALSRLNVCMDQQIGDEWVSVPNAYLWTRNLLTQATTYGLYGPNDPIIKNPSLIEDLWLFEKDLPYFLFNMMPSVFARPAWKARERVISALGEYYENRFYESDEAAFIIRDRARELGNRGISGSAAGRFELTVLHVGTSNTIPTIFWLLAYIFTDRTLTERLREEVERLTTVTEDTALFDLDNLPTTCPLLVSTNKETIRLTNKATGNRKVMTDTTISDGKGGHFSLKKGIDIQTAGQVLHLLESVWGPDAKEFNPERFMEVSHSVTNTREAAAAAKAKRASYVPFGGGVHLCPGRNFAFTETLGFMIMLLMAFEIEPENGEWSEWTRPKQDQCSIAAAVSKPASDGEGFGLRIRRRRGWEGRNLRFKIGGMVKEM